MKFNVNDEVRIKPTEYGKAIYREYYRPSSEPYGRPVPEIKVDADGWATLQLHQVMNIFGDYLYNGAKLPFETTIEIPEPDEPCPILASPPTSAPSRSSTPST